MDKKEHKPSFEELYAQAKKIQKKKEEREARHREEKLKKELEEATFKPQITPH